MRMYNVPTKFGACIKIANFQAKPLYLDMTSNENVYVPTKFGACIKNRKIFKLSHRPH